MRANNLCKITNNIFEINRKHLSILVRFQPLPDVRTRYNLLINRSRAQFHSAVLKEESIPYNVPLYSNLVRIPSHFIPKRTLHPVGGMIKVTKRHMSSTQCCHLRRF